MSKKYIVQVREVHVSSMEVEADSAEEAKTLVAEGGGDEIICEFSHGLDLDTWTVTDINGKELISQKIMNESK